MIADNDLKQKVVKKSHKGRNISIAIGIVVVLAGIGTGIWYAKKSSGNIKTITLTKQNMKEIIEVSGIVEAEKDVIIKSVSSGTIIIRNVPENLRVKKGTSFLEIDPQQSKLQLNQAKINAISSKLQAETELANAQKSLSDAISRHKSNVDNLDNQIHKIKNSIDFINKELKRNISLLKDGAIPRQTVDNQKQQLDQAKIDLRTAIDNIEKVKNEKGEIVVAQNRIEQAKTVLNNSINQGEAAISLSEDLLKKTVVNAPFDGTMTRWLVNVGDFVNPGASLGRFQDLNNIKVRFPVNELDLPKINPKNQIELVFDAYPDNKYHGHITWISQSSVADNENVQVFPVKVAFENPGYLIKPGMSGDASITVSEKKNVLAVPINSIFKKENKLFVKVLKDNKVQETFITPGISTIDLLEVRSGLKPGDKVVIEETKK